MVKTSNLQEARHGAQVTVNNLVHRAALGLLQMFDKNTGMFCHAMKKTADGMVQEGISPRYTAMTVMGLRRLEERGTASPIDTKPIIEALLTKTEWAANIGDLGLLFWFAAQVAPSRLEELEGRIKIEDALTRFEDAREGTTMHLAWFLTGISFYAQVAGKSNRLHDLAAQTFERIAKNQGKNGFFSHVAVARNLKASVRGWMGSFADQVYPIYGLTQFYNAFGDRMALESARQCGMAICEAQGPLGQWWWHYDSRSGTVFEKYPVFSVHQHGMAPMALLPLSKALGQSFDQWIYKGLEWIDRRNELSVNMEDSSANVIWRCIRQSRLQRVCGAVFGGRNSDQPKGLSVLHECRPYELGWLLYGLAELLQ